MAREPWVIVNDSEEAAALMTFGCQLIRNSPVARRLVGRKEVVSFTFAVSPVAARIRRLWNDKRLASGNSREQLAYLKRAFVHRRSLWDAVHGQASLILDYRTEKKAMLPIRDINCAASLMALEQRLFSPTPFTKEIDANGKALAVFNFERDDTSVYFSGAWEDSTFMKSNPTHLLTGFRALFQNHKLLLDAAARTNPYIHLKHGNWSFMIPKSKNDDGSEAKKLQNLLRAAERR